MTCGLESRVRPDQKFQMSGQMAIHENNPIPGILEPRGNEKIFRRNWERLIQEIFEDEPMAKKRPSPIPIPCAAVSPSLIFKEHYPLIRENSHLMLRAVRSTGLSPRAAAL